MMVQTGMLMAGLVCLRGRVSARENLGVTLHAPYLPLRHKGPERIPHYSTTGTANDIHVSVIRVSPDQLRFFHPGG